MHVHVWWSYQLMGFCCLLVCAGIGLVDVIAGLVTATRLAPAVGVVMSAMSV